jgi:outer membrane protein assembly factor BamB
VPVQPRVAVPLVALALVATTVVAVAARPASPAAPADPSAAPGASAAPGSVVGSPVPSTATSPAALPAGPALGPLGGDLLIADRGNDRLLIVTPAGQVAWSMTVDPGGPGGSQSWGPDDAFFTPDGRHIVINQENADTIAIIDIATKRVAWRYGHTGVPGSGPGYLDGPDDAYVLPDGTVTVADIRNERVLFISPAGRIVRQYGLTNRRRHDPPHSYAAPNGDVPLADGGMLVTEIGGQWVDRLDAQGRLAWSIHLRDIAYPSDAQLLPDGNVLVVDYSTIGQVEEVTSRGTVVWRYHVRSGPGMLSHPSLAARLPNGNIAVTDDFGQRVVVIDPSTHQVVWHYGHLGVPGTGPGYLDNPDGLDPVPPVTAQLLASLQGQVSAPAAAGQVAASVVATVAPFSLPAPLSRAAAVADGSAFLVLGGLEPSGASSATVLRVDPQAGTVSVDGRLAVAVHDAAAAALSGAVFVLGGGRTVAAAGVQRYDRAAGSGAQAGTGTLSGSLPQARADGAAVLSGATAYLVGGWDGTALTGAVLATMDGTRVRKVGVLGEPVRYPAVAASGGSIWVFGGERGGRAVAAIQRIDLSTGAATLAGALPVAVSGAAAVTLGRQIYLLGGSVNGRPSDRIWRFDPGTGTVAAAGTLPYAVADAAACVVGDTAYLVGGETPSAVSTIVAVRPG